MIHDFFAIALTLFFVIDALGNIPTYLSLIKPLDKKQQRKIAIRELLFALIIMVCFHYVGEVLLTLLGVSKTTVQISGGIILFLIALRLIFSKEESKIRWNAPKPFIVPIATPIIAGPSVLAVIMIFAQDSPHDLMIIGAIFVSWFFSSILFLFADPIYRLVTEKVLLAAQRLMGLIVAIIAVQSLLVGITGIIRP